MNFLAQHKLFVILGSIALAVGVWYTLAPSSATGPVLSSEGGDGPGRDVVETLRQLDAVKLDAAIFSEPAFTILKDFSTQIIPEPVGRPNPFAPLGQNIPANASSTHAAQIFAPSKKP